MNDYHIAQCLNVIDKALLLLRFADTLNPFVLTYAPMVGVYNAVLLAGGMTALSLDYTNEKGRKKYLPAIIILLAASILLQGISWKT